ncbi:MAG TPA: hypothetical protein VF678_13585 [bacterium]
MWKTIALVVALACLASPAWAQMTDKAVADTVALKKDGKGFDKFLGYDPTGQIARFTVQNQIEYLIDLKTQLCYVRPSGGGSLTPIRCKLVKTGYPTIAPLITWDD